MLVAKQLRELLHERSLHVCIAPFDLRDDGMTCARNQTTDVAKEFHEGVILAKAAWSSLRRVSWQSLIRRLFGFSFRARGSCVRDSAQEQDPCAQGNEGGKQGAREDRELRSLQERAR
jgi:hypothetical protein